MKFKKTKLKMITEEKYSYNPRKVKSTEDVVKLIKNIEDIDKLAEESMFLICLNQKNHILSYFEITRGGNCSCGFDFKTIFKRVLLCNATRFIVVHNHTSGDATPSRIDLKTTKQIMDASSLLHIDFLDHIIIGSNDTFVSCVGELKERVLNDTNQI